MQIPLKILVSSAPEPSESLGWEDAFDNWEAFTQTWDTFSGNGFIIDEAPLLDMFKDETLNIKQVVKDLSDPKKLFTEVSRSFTVPASKKNNKIFQHYYNIDINNGLDSRELIPCRLLLNNTTYKVGNLSVESVQMSKGVPSNYKIRFIGKLSELSRRIGEDELSEMNFDSINLNTYDSKAEFADNTADPLCFPLSSRSDRFLLDSTTRNLGFENARNVRYVGSVVDDNYGLTEQDLVGALSVGTILDKIASTYSISFDGVFTQDYIRDLYLWLHKSDKTRSGEQNVAQANTFSSFSTGFLGAVQGLSTDGVTFDLTGFAEASNGYSVWDVRVKGIWTGDGTLVLKKDGVPIKEHSITNTFSTFYLGSSAGVFSVDMKSDSNISADVYIEFVQSFSPHGGFTSSGYYEQVFEGVANVGTGGRYYMSENLPQMKIMDFMSSLFKMFNIVATVNNENVVSTKHFDHFMSEGVVKDFSPYIDVSKYDVKKPNLHSSINFQFADPKCSMELGYQKVNGKKYGELGYQLIGTSGVKLSGTEYKFKLDNQRVPLEPLRDLSDGSLTGIVYTQFADLKGAEQQTKPMFTYIARKSNATPIAWYDGASVSSINSYIQPSSIFCTNSSAPTGITSNNKVGLYFGEELNEYNTSETRVGTGLFSCFYRGLTAMMFDEDKRSVSFGAYIPMKEILNLNLADTLTINNNFYNINSIDTNYYSGKSKLELTLVGRSELSYFKLFSKTVTNTSTSTTLKLTHITSTGVLSQRSISVGSNITINYIGQILSFNHEEYTIS